MLPDSRPLLADRIRAALTERLGLKALSLLVAILLWGIVTSRIAGDGGVRAAQSTDSRATQGHAGGER